MQENTHKNIVIMGAGIAGIGAGYRFGDAATLYEARHRYGGLCDNFTIDGFRFDTAVHLSFANEKLVRSVFDQCPYYSHHPLAQNYCDGVWAKHPLQNNTYHLPVDERVRIIKSIMGRSAQQDMSTANNYQQWLEHQFGKYFADKYPGRYTRKYWCSEARDMSVDWITRRMYQPSIDEVLTGAMTDETPNTYYAAEMRYPKKGGYRAFFEHIADKMDIRLNHKVVHVDPASRQVGFENGTSVGYETLINTLPLPYLIGCLPHVPEQVQAAANKLYASSVTIVSIGYRREIAVPALWFYVYDEDILFARGYSPSMKSPDNVPVGKSSLQFEIYQTRHKRVHMTDGEIVEHVIQSLDRMGISTREDIQVQDIRHLPYGNVVFYQGMEQDRAIVREYIRSLDIISVGRWGRWEYLWSNQAFKSGYNARL